jgi:hypothetical protein
MIVPNLIKHGTDHSWEKGIYIFQMKDCFLKRGDSQEKAKIYKCHF